MFQITSETTHFQTRRQAQRWEMASPLTVHSRAGISAGLLTLCLGLSKTNISHQPGLSNWSNLVTHWTLFLSKHRITSYCSVCGKKPCTLLSQTSPTPSTCLPLIPKSSPQVLNKSQLSGTSLAVQWLSLCSSVAGDTGSILGWGN